MLLSSVLEAIRETYRVRHQVQKRAIKIGLDAAALLPSCWSGEFSEAASSSSASSQCRWRMASFHEDVDEGYDIHRLLSQESNRSLSYSEDSVADEDQLQPPLLPERRHSLFSASNESIVDAQELARPVVGSIHQLPHHGWNLMGRGGVLSGVDDNDAGHHGVRMRPAAALVSEDDMLVIAQWTCEAVATVAQGMFSRDQNCLICAWWLWIRCLCV